MIASPARPLIFSGRELILAPFLKRAIPASVWQQHLCLVVHPGPPGDRGPSALDWAILRGATAWGVTVLQANAEWDAGPVWASALFPMRAARKSSLYRNEVTEAAVIAVRDGPQPSLGGQWSTASRHLPGGLAAARAPSTARNRLDAR